MVAGESIARQLKLQGVPDPWPGSEPEPKGRSGWRATFRDGVPVAGSYEK